MIYKSRIRLWKCTATVVVLILFLQMAVTFGFIYLAFKQNNITQLQWLFSTFFGGLLIETYLLARLIVKWLFQDIPYKPD